MTMVETKPIKQRREPMSEDQFADNMRGCLEILAFGGPFDTDAQLFLCHMTGRVVSSPLYFAHGMLPHFEEIGYTEIFPKYRKESVSETIARRWVKSGNADRNIGMRELVSLVLPNDYFADDYSFYRKLMGDVKAHGDRSQAFAVESLFAEVRPLFDSEKSFELNVSDFFKVNLDQGEDHGEEWVRLTLSVANDKPRKRLFPKRLSDFAFREGKLAFSMMMVAYLSVSLSLPAKQKPVKN